MNIQEQYKDWELFISEPFDHVREIPYPECAPGWYPMIKELVRVINNILNERKDNKISVKQIKEKWGTLRFYYDIDNSESNDRLSIDGAIAMAESYSKIICGLCGGVKQVNRRLCDPCDTTNRVHSS